MFLSLGSLACVAMFIILFLINKKRARYVEENGGPDGVLDKDGEVTLTEMGDKSPLFKYTL